MRNYKLLLLTIVSLLIFEGCTNNKAASSKRLSFLPGLTKANLDELKNTEMRLDGETVPIYHMDGKRVQGMEMMTALMSGAYSPDPYVDSENEIKAYVLRKLSDEEMTKNKDKIKKLSEPKELQQRKSPLVGKKAPAFVATDLNGNAYSLADLKGKIVVLNFWFIACKPCLIEIPELNNLVEKYSEKEVVFLAITFDKKIALESFLQKQNFEYNIIPNSKDIIGQYKVYSFPTHIIIDKTSTVDLVLTGLSPSTVEQIDHAIARLNEK